MKPFSELSAEELAMENLFIRWVRFPDDPPIRSFWEGWIVKYPAMKDTVARARELGTKVVLYHPNSITRSEYPVLSQVAPFLPDESLVPLPAQPLLNVLFRPENLFDPHHLNWQGASHCANAFLE